MVFSSAPVFSARGPGAATLGARTRAPDPLLPAARDFFATRDLAAFFESVSPWIIDYAGRRLNRDPDIVGDFYVHVYDRVPEYLRDYQSRQESVPFTAFFAVCLRNEFMNFIRARRRAAPLEQEWSENMQPQKGAHALPRTLRPPEGEHRLLTSLFFQRLDRLPLRLRLPVKLTHGLDPDRDELRELVRLLGGAEPASAVVYEFHRRREVRSRRLRRLEDRIAHLSYLIDSYERRPDLRGTPRQWSRWKARLHRVLCAQHPLFSLGELGGIFGRNKSTIMRRVERAIALLRDTEPTQNQAAGL